MWGIVTHKGVRIEVNADESQQTLAVHPEGQSWQPLPPLTPQEAHALSMVMALVALKRIGRYERRLYRQLVEVARTLDVRVETPDPAAGSDRDVSAAQKRTSAVGAVSA